MTAKELSLKYKTLLSNNEINTPKRLAMFFAQLDHESGLKTIAENLNYSAEGLLKVFPKYFNSTTAKEYARQPEKIANKVYANRMGNGSESSGDGWKYRGRGFIQITGKENYTKAGYKDNPEKLLNEADAMVSALWYWRTNRLNVLTDKQNSTNPHYNSLESVTRAINGGLNGLADREKKFNKYLVEFV